MPVRFPLKLVTQQGGISYRDAREGGRHSVSRRWLARIGLGLEAGFRDDLALAVVQFNYRLDDQSFGGGNVQVQFRF